MPRPAFVFMLQRQFIGLAPNNLTYVTWNWNSLVPVIKYLSFQRLNFDLSHVH